MYKSYCEYLKIFFVEFFLVCIPLASFAQTGALDPYSRFGLGSLNSESGVRSSAMGGIGVGMSGVKNISTFNPATYAFGVDTLSVQFDLGFDLKINSLSQNSLGGVTATNESSASGLTNLDFFFPVSNWWKMGVFMSPVSTMSYMSSVYNNSSEMPGKTQELFEGSGGTSKVGFGNAFKIQNFSVGMNVNYHFGYFSQTNILLFEDSLASSGGHTLYRSHTALRGFTYDFGLLYFANVGYQSRLTFGLAYTLGGNLNGLKSSEAFVDFGGGVMDTAFIYPNQKGNIYMPASYRFGVSFEQMKKWLVGLDLTYQEWSKYTSFDKPLAFAKNTYSASLGVELKHDKGAAQWYKRLDYRAGGRYSTLFADFGDKGLNEYSISLGVGIPIRRSRSMINVALEYGTSGALSKGQVEENFFTFKLGFTAIEAWFLKRKYD